MKRERRQGKEKWKRRQGKEENEWEKTGKGRRMTGGKNEGRGIYEGKGDNKYRIKREKPEGDNYKKEGKEKTSEEGKHKRERVNMWKRAEINEGKIRKINVRDNKTHGN